MLYVKGIQVWPNAQVVAVGDALVNPLKPHNISEAIATGNLAARALSQVPTQHNGASLNEKPRC